MRFLAQARLVSNHSRGFSLVEILLVVVAVGLLVALLGNVPRSMSLITKSKHQSLAREIALKQVEDKRATTYSNLTNTSLPGGDPFTDSRLDFLPSGLGKITVEDCAPSVCTNGEEVKRVTVEVTWTEAGKNQAVKISSMIAKGGLNQ